MWDPAHFDGFAVLGCELLDEFLLDGVDAHRHRVLDDRQHPMRPTVVIHAGQKLA